MSNKNDVRAPHIIQAKTALATFDAFKGALAIANWEEENGKNH